MKYILLSIFALALAIGGTLPAQAHAPKVGEEGKFIVACKEDAHNVLVETARTEGLRATAPLVRRFMMRSKCFNAAPTGVPARIMEVAEPVYTPDGFILYPLRIQPLDGPSTVPWFAAHTHKIEGTAI